MIAKRTPLYMGWLFIALTITGVVAMNWVIFPQAEDMEAYCFHRDMYEYSGQTHTFDEFVDLAESFYMTSNGRFVNFADIFLTGMTPRWVWIMADLLFMILFYILIYRLARYATGTAGGKAPGVTVMGILTLLCFPWNDYLFLQRYTTPYIWGVVWLMAAAWSFLKIMDIPTRSRGKDILLCALFWVVMFICGGWHEGNVLCLFGPLAVMWFTAPRKSRTSLAIGLLCMAAALLLNLTAPGHNARVETVGISLNLFNWFQPRTLTGGIWLCPHIVPQLAYLAVTAVLLLYYRRRMAAVIRDIMSRGILYGAVSISRGMKLQLLCVLVTMANLGLNLFFCMPRTAVTGIIFSITGMTALVMKYYPAVRNRTAIRIINLSLIICPAILLANIAVNVITQIRLSDDHRTIQRLLADSKDGTVFYDPAQHPHYSNYPWQWTMNHFYVNYVPLHFIQEHPSNKRRLPLRLIPTALRHIPDTIEIKGITRLGNDFVSDREPALTDSADAPRTEIYPPEYPFLKTNADVITVSGRRRIQFYEFIPFSPQNRPDVTLYYLRPVFTSPAQISDPPVRILSFSLAKYW